MQIKSSDDDQEIPINLPGQKPDQRTYCVLRLASIPFPPQMFFLTLAFLYNENFIDLIKFYVSAPY